MRFLWASLIALCFIGMSSFDYKPVNMSKPIPLIVPSTPTWILPASVQPMENSILNPFKRVTFVEYKFIGTSDAELTDPDKWVLIGTQPTCEGQLKPCKIRFDKDLAAYVIVEGKPNQGILNGIFNHTFTTGTDTEEFNTTAVDPDNSSNTVTVPVLVTKKASYS